MRRCRHTVSRSWPLFAASLAAHGGRFPLRLAARRRRPTAEVAAFSRAEIRRHPLRRADDPRGADRHEPRLPAPDLALLALRQGRARGCASHRLPAHEPWAKQAGDELCRRYGFTKLAVRNPMKAPVGAVLVYGGPDAGHVEIRTATGFVSDFVSPTPYPRPFLGPT